MPDYALKAPGVYIEEIPAVGPIQGVGTSTVAFIGTVAGFPAVVGPTPPPTPTPAPGTTQPPTTAPPATTPAPARPSPTTPTLVTNWTQYKDLFGEYAADTASGTAATMLPYAVRGFFDNGGTRAYIVNQSDVAAALEALTRYDINIVVAPNATTNADHTKILDHCRQQTNRFAILHLPGPGAQPGLTTASPGPTTAAPGPTTAPPGGDASDPATLAGRLHEPTKRGYGAIYHPWIQVSAPTGGTDTRAIPPSGHIAGIYARSDTERGVHKAPANEVIRGALGVTALLNDTEHGGLNAAGVNVLRVFPNSPPMVWGARSLTRNTAYRHVNVERLLIYIEESLRAGLRWAVFEPNDFTLWKKLERTVTEFLTRIWRAGALFGNAPEQAFTVKIDEEVNPPGVRTLGIVVIEIAVAPVRPAEFVVIRLALREGGADGES